MKKQGKNCCLYIVIFFILFRHFSTNRMKKQAKNFCLYIFKNYVLSLFNQQAEKASGKLLFAPIVPISCS